jgi:single-stranded DNA-binding protein
VIDALVAGRICGKPQARTAKNGAPFAVGRIRVATRDGGALFVSVISFSASAVPALLALDDGDSVALAGELTPKVYTAKNGEPRPALDLLAHAVLSEYSVSRKREAAKAAKSAGPQAESEAPAEPQPAPGEHEFDDALPF